MRRQGHRVVAGRFGGPKRRGPAHAPPKPCLPRLPDLVDEMEVLAILAAAEKFVIWYRAEGSYRRYRRLADLVLRRYRARLAQERALEAAAAKATPEPHARHCEEGASPSKQSSLDRHGPPALAMTEGEHQCEFDPVEKGLV